MKKIIFTVCALMVSASLSAQSLQSTDLISYEKERGAAVKSINKLIKKAGGLERLKKDALEHNDASANYALGQMYRFGIVVQQNNHLAIEHLKASSKLNHAESSFVLAKMIGDKDPLTPGTSAELTNKAESYSLTKKSAELGVVEAQYHMGLYYINGEHFPEDRDLGLFWLSRAADAGHEDAKLARMKFLYTNDELRKSYDSVRLRASEGHLPSMIVLAKFYRNGWVVQRDATKANRLLNAAASMGSKEAIDLLR